jgi:acyl carrier protein
MFARVRPSSLDFATFATRVASLLGLVAVPTPGEPVDLCDDLGLDSFQAYELLVIIEDLADADLPPVELPNLRTMRDAYSYYLSLLGS